MAIAPASAITTGVPDAGYQAPSQDIGEQEFLTLLMTQLSNQDPLNPMESQQFMEQVASMNQVQQLMDANDRLDALMMGITSLNNQSAVDLVGQEVIARGDTFTHKAGQGQDLQFDLAGEAAEGSVSIHDENGTLIRVIEFDELKAGENSVHWDGENTDGEVVGHGDYTFTVNASDAEGNGVDAITYISGVVDELRFDGGIPILMVGSEEVTLDEIVRVLDIPDPVAGIDLASLTRRGDEADNNRSHNLND